MTSILPRRARERPAERGDPATAPLRIDAAALRHLRVAQAAVVVMGRHHA